MEERQLNEEQKQNVHSSHKISHQSHSIAILYPEITSCFYPNFISEVPGMVPNYPANRGNIIISYTIQGNPSGEQTA